MKKILVFCLLLVTLVMLLSACKKTSEDNTQNPSDAESHKEVESLDEEENQEGENPSHGRVDKNNITTVKVMLEESNGNMGFYIRTGGDPLVYNADWSVRYGRDSALEGGVYVNDKLTSVYLMKIEEGRYYVALSDFGIDVYKGTTVTIDTTVQDGKNVVTFEKTTFVFDGTTWSVK